VALWRFHLAFSRDRRSASLEAIDPPSNNIKLRCDTCVRIPMSSIKIFSFSCPSIFFQSQGSLSRPPLHPSRICQTHALLSPRLAKLTFSTVIPIDTRYYLLCCTMRTVVFTIGERTCMSTNATLFAKLKSDRDYNCAPSPFWNLPYLSQPMPRPHANVLDHGYHRV